MNERAHVKSIESLDAFRSTLIRYKDRMGIVLEEISAEVLQLRMWLQNDRLLYWKHQISARERKLEEIKQAWFRGELSDSQTGSVSKADVRRAREQLREAEEKMMVVKRWCQLFDSKVATLAREPDKLRGFLGGDLPKALAYLKEVVNTLDEYSDYAPSRSSIKPPVPTDTDDLESGEETPS